MFRQLSSQNNRPADEAHLSDDTDDGAHPLPAFMLSSQRVSLQWLPSTLTAVRLQGARVLTPIMPTCEKDIGDAGLGPRHLRRLHKPCSSLTTSPTRGNGAGIFRWILSNSLSVTLEYGTRLTSRQPFASLRERRLPARTKSPHRRRPLHRSRATRRRKPGRSRSAPRPS